MERRQFGRRSTNTQAWIRTGGRPKLSCVIRNFSPKGAFLELVPPSWLPFRFELLIEPENVPIECEIRHAMQHGIGVVFCLRDEAAEKPVAIAVEDVGLWTGHQKGAPARALRK